MPSPTGLLLPLLLLLAPVAGAAPDRGDYLVVHPPALAAAARAWAAYRAGDGWAVRPVAVTTDDDTEATRAAIRDAIVTAHRRATAAERPLAVLLLGDVDALPAWYEHQDEPRLVGRHEPVYATDLPYQLPDADGRPSFPLGRVPAPDDAAALDLLRRIVAYEQETAPGAWRRRVHVVAGEGHFGAADALLEVIFVRLLDALVPKSFSIDLVYAKATSPFCPAPSALGDTVLDRLGGDCLMFCYIGHGHATHLDRLVLPDRSVPILDRDDLARLDGDPTRAPIAVLTCCSAGWYDGAEPCLAEAMLFNPSGPIAVIAGSRLTHTYANAAFQKNVAAALATAPTVGDLDLAADRGLIDPDGIDRQIDLLARPFRKQWSVTRTYLRRSHVALYNLLGDPATHVPAPRGRLELRGDGERLHVTSPDVRTGTVRVTIETPRVLPAHPDRLALATPETLEAVAPTNLATANDPVLWSAEVALVEGAATVALPAPLPDRAEVVRAVAVGVDGEGRETEGVAVMAVAAVRASGE